MTHLGKHATRMPGEFYHCYSCEQDFEPDQVWDEWLCPCCELPISIFAESEAANDKGVFHRKRAKEIEVGVLVKPGHMRVDKCYEVLGIAHVNSDRLRMGLRGYGQITVQSEEWLSVRVGGW